MAFQGLYACSVVGSFFCVTISGRRINLTRMQCNMGFKAIPFVFSSMILVDILMTMFISGLTSVDFIGGHGI